MTRNNVYQMASILLCLAGVGFATTSLSQDIEVYNHFRIASPDGYSQVQCLPTTKLDVEVNTELTYYWCTRNAIHNSQGGFSGYLMHGPYERFNLEGSVLEKGQYDHGLKQGEWKQWQESGKLLQHISYENGLLHGEARYFNTDGKLIKSATYQNGMLNGELLIYKADTVYSQKKYRKGRLIRIDHKPVDKTESVPE